LYDTGVYSVPNASGTPFIDITKTTDILSINQLQYLTAAKNIYFNNWEDADKVKSEFEIYFEKRPRKIQTTTIYVRDDTATIASVTGRWSGARAQTVSAMLAANCLICSMANLVRACLDKDKDLKSL
jgi:hypothetical protein